MTQARRSVLRFFVLAFALAIPLWLLSPFIGVIGSMRIPVSDLGLAFVPMITALILTQRDAPSKANEAAFSDAVEEVFGVARRLIDRLETSASPRDREDEAKKAKQRAAVRFGRPA